MTLKKKLGIVLIIVVTIGCILLGIRTREKNGILVTQLQTVSEGALSYMLETNKNNVIMIDGGSYEDSKHLEEVLLEKGGVVDQWFITMANPASFGAMQRIIENGTIQINHIYISFNQADWYERYEPEIYPQIAEFLDLIYSEDIITKVYDVPLRYELLVDNYYITVLNVKNPDFEDEYAVLNQSMVIKVNNTYKSMIFMGNLAEEGAEKLKDNNLDEIDCDAVQISNNGKQKVKDEIYEKMTPNYIFMPTSQNSNETGENTELESLRNKLKVEQENVVIGGDVTVRIW